MSTLLYFEIAEKNSCGCFLPHFVCFRHHDTGSGEGAEFEAKAHLATSAVQKDENSCIYIRLSTPFSKHLNGA